MHSDEFYIENWNPRLLLGPKSHFGIFFTCSYFHPHIITIVDVKVIPMTIYLLLPFKEFICGYNKVRKNLNAMILTHILPYKINFEEFTFSPPIMMIYISKTFPIFYLKQTILFICELLLRNMESKQTLTLTILQSTYRRICYDWNASFDPNICHTLCCLF